MIEFRRAQRRAAEVELTPLIDVVFQLLVFFLLTSAFIAETIPLELPEASTGERTPGTLTVSIDRGGQIFFDAVPVSLGELRDRVRAARHDHAELRAVIAADGRTAHARVVKVIDLLREEQISSFAFNVTHEEAKP